MVSASERGGEDVIADAGTWNFVERVNGMRGHRFLPSSNFGRRHRTEGLDQLTWLSHKPEWFQECRKFAGTPSLPHVLAAAHARAIETCHG